MTSQCDRCKRIFPEHLINIIFTSIRNESFCPLCALLIRNTIHGLPSNEPFHGIRAKALYDEAVAYLVEQDQGAGEESKWR